MIECGFVEKEFQIPDYSVGLFILVRYLIVNWSFYKPVT